MRFLFAVFSLAIVGCTTTEGGDDFYCDDSCQASFDASDFDAALADVHVNPATDATSDATDGGCGGSCDAGQLCSYDPGCASPAKSCHTDTGGDAVALTYCACDGHEFTTSELFPTQPYENAGHCAVDGGEDASDDGG
jgi:hypothetical protein